MRIVTLAVGCVMFAGTASAQAPVSQVRLGSALKFDVNARVEADSRMATPSIGIESANFTFGTPRIGVEGALFKKVEFEVSRDLGIGGEWRDVYVNVRPTKAFEVEIGQFKLPFGRETLTGRKNLDFINRSLIATQLAPGRDTGVMAHGRLLRRHVHYAAGYFTGDGDNARTSSTAGGERAIAGRLVVMPLSNSASGTADESLQIGVAVTQSHLADVLGLRGRTAFHDDVFFDRVSVNGNRWRRGIEASWAHGPLSLSSEFMAVSDARSGMGFEGDDLEALRARGWYVAGTWALTGEQKSGRLEPRHRLFGGGAGAFELVARVEQLRFADLASAGGSLKLPSSSAIPGNADRATTVGLNWYLNHYLKIQTNLVIESIEDPERSPAPSARGRFMSGVVRMQFTL